MYHGLSQTGKKGFGMNVSQISASDSVNFSSRFKQHDVNKFIHSAKRAYGWDNPAALPKLHAMLEFVDKLNFKSVSLEEYNEFIKNWDGGRLNVVRHRIKADGKVIGKSFNPYFALLNTVLKDSENIGEENLKRMTNQEFLDSWRSHKYTTENEIKKFAIEA